MCGVIFARRRDKRPVSKALLRRYNKQKARGQRGFGFIAIENGFVKEVHRFEKEADAETAIESAQAHEILFHHRMPTSTPNYKDMTHPIVVKNDELAHDYYLIHNGVLQNENTLRKEHIEMGYSYTTDMQEINTVKTKHNEVETVTESFNDSEALAIEVARFLDGKSESIRAVGTIAFICLETDKEGRVLNIHYGRNSGNPLVVENNGDLLFIKSTGDGVEVPINLLNTIDYKTGNLSTRVVQIGRRDWQDYQSRQAGFGFNKDDERVADSNFRHLLSPVQRDGRGGLDWKEDDFPLSCLPTIDYDGTRAPSYKNSEEYLLDLWAELDSLEQDIEMCKNKLDDPVTSDGERIYAEEYLQECEENLAIKRKEATDLEDFLASQGR